MGQILSKKTNKNFYSKMNKCNFCKQHFVYNKTTKEIICPSCVFTLKNDSPLSRSVFLSFSDNSDSD